MCAWMFEWRQRTYNSVETWNMCFRPSSVREATSAGYWVMSWHFMQWCTASERKSFTACSRNHEITHHEGNTKTYNIFTVARGIDSESFNQSIKWSNQTHGEPKMVSMPGVLYQIYMAKPLVKGQLTMFLNNVSTIHTNLNQKLHGEITVNNT